MSSHEIHKILGRARGVPAADFRDRRGNAAAPATAAALSFRKLRRCMGFIGLSIRFWFTIEKLYEDGPLSRLEPDEPVRPDPLCAFALFVSIRPDAPKTAVPAAVLFRKPRRFMDCAPFYSRKNENMT
jgi:hypothetical protein